MKTALLIAAILLTTMLFGCIQDSQTNTDSQTPTDTNLTAETQIVDQQINEGLINEEETLDVGSII
jgi:hypothetical protein